MMSTRTAFLAACQWNNYQFDTMRRATYSTMMTLFHLHHPGAPTTSHLCLYCGQEICPGDGLACKTSTDYTV
ncbi:unnamed protein product, partial [Hapterophycus canaliculatus]